MAFVKVIKSRYQGAKEGEPLVTMGAYLADGKVHKTKSIAFRITRALIDKLGWADKTNVLRVGVFEGTDEDKGFIQLAITDGGYTATLPEEGSKNRGISINVTADRLKHYVLNECPVPANVVTHVVDDDVLLIECPDWLRFNPLSIPKPEPEPEPEPPIRLNREERRALAAKVARRLK